MSDYGKDSVQKWTLESLLESYAQVEADNWYQDLLVEEVRRRLRRIRSDCGDIPFTELLSYIGAVTKRMRSRPDTNDMSLAMLDYLLIMTCAVADAVEGDVEDE